MHSARNGDLEVPLYFLKAKKEIYRHKNGKYGWI
jgi:hypothetical protein